MLCADRQTPEAKQVDRQAGRIVEGKQASNRVDAATSTTPAQGCYSVGAAVAMRCAAMCLRAAAQLRLQSIPSGRYCLLLSGRGVCALAVPLGGRLQGICVLWI